MIHGHESGKFRLLMSLLLRLSGQAHSLRGIRNLTRLVLTFYPGQKRTINGYLYNSDVYFQMNTQYKLTKAN